MEELRTESPQPVARTLDDDRVIAKNDIALLKTISRGMKSNPEIYLLIQGYADPYGTYLYNLDLPGRRTAHVKEILVDQGISEHCLMTIGNGVFPAVDDASDLGYARKVSFLLFSN